MAVKLIILRVDRPNIGKTVGDVISIIPHTQYEGKEVEAVGKTFVRAVVTDLTLDDPLVQDLLNGTKKLLPPDPTSTFYQELLTNGIITVDTATINNYIGVV